MRHFTRFGLTLCLVGLTTGWARAQETPPEAPNRAAEARWPGITSRGLVLLPNGWSLKPAGRQLPMGDFPILIAECPTQPVLAISHAGYGEHEIVTTNLNGKVIGRVAIPETFGGLVWSADGKRLFVGGGFDGVVYRFDHDNGLLSTRSVLTFDPGTEPTTPVTPIASDEPLTRAERGSNQATGSIAGLALSADGKTLWVANAFAHRLERVDAETGQLLGDLDLGKLSYPYAIALDDQNGRVYVSLWGKAAVAVVDVANPDALAATWSVEEHPNEMRLTQDGSRLYVANANRNTVTVFDTKASKAVETINTAISPQAPPGCTPNALALTPDESILLIANANTNDVAAFNVSELGRSIPLGFIPTGWYPTSVRVTRDGKNLLIANGKGSTPRANPHGPNPAVRTPSIREYIAGLFQGTLQIVAMPTPNQMAAYTKTVYECSPVDRLDPERPHTAGREDNNPIPAKVGDASPIKYCVYIIKENRTYDQVFGDIEKGNGEKNLCLFPEEVTPNHHALANQFVLLDNFYVESEVSADGHEWTMGAYATDFVERLWPLSYRGDKRIGYPSEGNFAQATPARGYLWDQALAKNVSYYSFGEFIANPKKRGEPATAKIPTLEGHFDPFFWGYDLEVKDQERTDRFLEVLKGWEAEGEMPRLITLRLGNDHTSGTRVGALTPTAMVADNDLALGRAVEGLSKSRFWPELAIFVVEDDAQNGPDHVDAHRTVALAISPYIKRGTVDSTLYSTSSMLRTMELILGLDPMSQFDAAATPMYASFGPEPNLEPYVALPARVDLDAKNEATAWGADISATLNLAVEDAADDLLFNEIIWRSVRGADSPMPPPVRAAFVIPDIEDGEEE